jgi:hypothetical protein
MRCDARHRTAPRHTARDSSTPRPRVSLRSTRATTAGVAAISPVRPTYTFTVFHLPRENSHSVNSPTEVSDTNTPQNTPD